MLKEKINKAEALEVLRLWKENLDLLQREGDKAEDPVQKIPASNPSFPTESISYCSNPSFPTKPGSYSSGPWRYTYDVKSRGSSSERRFGYLYQHGKKLEGAPGEIAETPLGRFVYFEHGYNQGWLNTLAYDRPVFTDNGELTEDADYHLSFESPPSHEGKV